MGLSLESFSETIFFLFESLGIDFFEALFAKHTLVPVRWPSIKVIFNGSISISLYD